MDSQEKEGVIAALQEELQGFFAWIVNEIGADYYIEDPQRASDSVEEEARKTVAKRISSKRLQLWERDWYAFFHDSRHPSIYELFKADDLEIVHYLEEFSCEHFKVLDTWNEQDEPDSEPEKRYEQSFGVLLASQTLGWMYRLDFCEICGLIEVWSMQYNPDEIALYEE